jgi:hypothetical protein
MMKCLRCGGLMTCENYLTRTELGELGLCDGWRCLNCGELVDAVILSHRRHTPAAPHADSGATASAS